MKRLAALLTVAATLLTHPSPAIAGPGEIELRGTLLCKVEGDDRREKALDGHYLVVVPEGYPQSSEVLDEAGFFRLRLPSSCVDQHVVLRVLHGSEDVHLMRVLVERGRLRKFGDRSLYQLGAASLPGRCEDYAASQAEALALRDRLRRSADTLGVASREGGGISKPVVGGVLGTVLTGLGFLVAPSSAEAGSKIQISAPERTYGMPPGDWPLYTQFSSSPGLGRTLTPIRAVDEAVFWNPSALVRQVGHRLTVSGGERDEYRVSGVYQLPVAGASFLVPRTVSAGYLGYLDTKTKTETLENRIDVNDIYNNEQMFFAGLGFAPARDVAFAVNVNEYRQKFGSEIRSTNSVSGKTVSGGSVIRETVRDVDLSLTWDARHDLRLAAAAYHVGGTEAKNHEDQDVALQRGVLGASWVRGKLLVGGEFGMNTGDLGGSLGLNYRVTDWLGLDLSGGTRFETIQAGVDLHRGPFTGRFRVRTDDRQDTAVQFGMGIAG